MIIPMGRKTYLSSDCHSLLFYSSTSYRLKLTDFHFSCHFQWNSKRIIRFLFVVLDQKTRKKKSAAKHLLIFSVDHHLPSSRKSWPNHCLCPACIPWQKAGTQDLKRSLIDQMVQSFVAENAGKLHGSLNLLCT